jgi:hypothetical protein
LCFHKTAVLPLRQHRVPAFDLVELAQNRLRPRVKRVAQAPLNVADPDRGAGDFGGQAIDLEGPAIFAGKAYIDQLWFFWLAPVSCAIVAGILGRGLFRKP